MKAILYLAALLLCSDIAGAQMRLDFTFDVDSATREFILAVPTTPPPPGGYPIVFMFHGTSQGGELFFNESQWKEKGEAENFLTVFPTALRYCLYDNGVQRTTTKWHNGELDDSACAGQVLRSDMNFVRAMLDTIESMYPIDHSRIFASGFSNGASFASKLAIRMSDVFAAVAVSGGTVHRLDSAKPIRNIPYWFNVGTLDDKWLSAFSGVGLTEFPFNDTALVYFRSTLRRNLGVFGLDTTYAKDSAGRVLSYTFTTPAVPEPTAPFRFTLINNMFHVYPNGNNVPFVAANIFWEFFKAAVTPASAPSDRRDTGTVSIYPNPATDYVQIGGRGEVTLLLRTILGDEVFRATAEAGTRIALPALPRGLYFASLDGAQATMVLLRVE